MSIKTERQLSRAKKLVKKRELDDARKIYKSILRNFPNNQEAKKGLLALDQGIDLSPTKEQMNSLMSLYSSGQIQDALANVNQLIEIYPNDSLLFNICGACYSNIGPDKSAIDCFLKAIQLKPDYAEAYYNLGVAYHKTNMLEEALESYNNAIEFQHAYPTAHNNIGIIYLNKDKINSAVKSFEWAIAYDANYAEAHNNLGSALQQLKQFKKAKKEFEIAISLNSNYAQAFHNLGILSEIINLPEEALNNYERAVSIYPEFAEAFRNLSKVKTYKANDEQISQMYSLYSKSDLNLSDKARISFALAEANKDLGKQEEFFKFLNEGNMLRKKVLNYSFDQSKNFHSTIIKLFKSSQPILKNSSKNNSDIKPIFIVGMPRSGTSLVEQIISSHNSVHGAGELLNFRNILTPILENHLNKGVESFLEEDFISIRKEYLNSLVSLNTKEKIITDKMQMNFRLIGFILSAIPEAKIIHVKRDPIATCWSNYSHYFTAGNGFSFDQQDLTKFYTLYIELMSFWHELFPKKIYDLSYENLTLNQKSETKKLIKYCGLEWDEECLNFHNNKRAVLTASSAQVRKKMYQGSSDAWKEYENYIQPLVKGLKNL